jgi:hypothetical protein
VLRYDTIKVEQNRTYTVTGTRALALVADRTLLVEGVIDISGSAIVNGPGGGLQKSGTGQSAAGGGAGFRTAGGSGGTQSVDGGAANAGAPGTSPALLSELFGGTQATKGTNGHAPGGGGGALTLISCRGEVAVTGTIDAGGGGGRGCSAQLPNPTVYASGGGSGGTVVLQGMTISVTGQIYANGGGGGGGGEVGNHGTDGTRSTMRAGGGSPSGINVMSGFGGFGGATQAPANGERESGGFPGAGGGSAGYILTYTPQFVFPTLTPFAVSPAFEPNGTVATN